MAGPPDAAAALREVMPAPAAPTAAAVATRNRLRRDEGWAGADCLLQLGAYIGKLVLELIKAAGQVVGHHGLPR